MRSRILHAIELLSKWSSAVVKPPEKTISAHDAMGGGDVMGGGEYGGNNGWGYSFGKWPNQVQQQQLQQPQLQQPQQQQAPVASIQYSIPNSAPAAGPVNVRDWVKEDDPLNRSPTPPHSRRSSAGNRQDIFIPPDNNNDWTNSNHIPISFRPRSRHPTPDPDWHYSAESLNNNNNSFPPGSRAPRADLYSLESFDRSINSMLHQSHHRNTNLAAIPANSQRVIPVNTTRKQNEMRRKKERERERQSKWIPLSGRRDSDVSDSSDEEPSPRLRTWYPPPVAPPAPACQPPQLRIQGPPPPMLSQSRQGHHHLPHPSLTSGPAPVSSVPPPPPPLQMPVPPPIMNQQQQQHMPIGLHSPPQSFGPAQLAQYQFEQQQKVYQFQKQQQEHQQHQQKQYHQQQQYHHQPQHLQQSSSWHSNTGVAIYR